PPRSGRSGPLSSLLSRASRQQASLDPIAEVAALTDVHLKLLSATSDLLEAYQRILTQMPRSESPPLSIGPAEMTLSAGPFETTEAVRSFERTLSELPEVLDVAVRGYERGNRVLIEVRLS